MQKVPNDDAHGAPVKVISEKEKRRMLIVDDKEADRKLLTALFAEQFIVDVAFDGKSALMRLRHYGAGVSVVLMDLSIPGTDSFAVLDAIRSSTEMGAVPVIAISGADERDTGLRAIQAGAADYVERPLDPEHIKLRVASAISRAETEQKMALCSRLLLQSSEAEKYRTVLNSTGMAVIEYDWVGGIFTYDSSISKHIAGVYDSRRLWRILLSDMVADAMDVQTMQCLVHDVANDRTREEGSMMVRLKTPSGARHWFRMRIFKRIDEFQLTSKLLITFLDVNGEVLAEEKLRFQAERDELTGLLNRAAFFEKAEALIAAKPAGSYVLSCLDIDNFKVLNDQYGPEKGDEVLKGIAAGLQQACDKDDCLCCRIVSDDFAVLYPIDMMAADRAEEHKQETAMLRFVSLPVRISMGRYIISDTSLGLNAMYDRAVIAQSTVKGRYDVHVAVYDESMRTRLLNQQEIANDMNAALEQQQFEVWLQPQYNHATGALIGAEALVRWRHPTRGLIPPGEFIPTFERNGFVYEVDKYVWNQACAYLRKWIDEGRSPLPISVNVSRYDLLCADLLARITDAVERHAIPASLLRLEITESAFSEDAERIIRVVKSLIEYGFLVEIDDFGSGYSSLNTLKDVPAQVLKMDMRFLENNENSHRGGNILESVVRMAKWLGMAVIAEGVETKTQADYLKSIGCNYIQGYLYAKPMPAAEYEALAGGAFREETLESLKTVENLDNSAFWDPQSMDTLIFNSFVGAACIFEYNGGKIELVRATDKYAQVIGNAGMTVEEALKLDWAEHLDAESLRRVREAVMLSIATHDEVTNEYVFHNLPGCPENTYLRSTLRVIATVGERCLIYCTNENTTAQRAAELNERKTAEHMQAIMGSINCGVTATAVRDGATAFLFANDRYYKMLGFTQAQYNAEVESLYDLIHPDDQTRVREAMARVMESSEPAVLEYRVLCRDGRMIWVQNALSVTRFDGVDVPVQLGITTDITQEKNAQKRIHALNENLQTIMTDMPGGFARLRVRPNGVIITEYANDSFCQLRGVTMEEIQQAARRDEDIRAHVHPDDRELVSAAIAEMLASGETCRIQYRLQHANGTYIPFNVFGRVTRGEDGDAVINAYFVDMTAREKQALSLQETIPYVLSAIMKSSTELSFAKDKDLVYLCCSHAFAKMVGLENEADIVGKTDFDLFADRALAEQYRADDFRLMESGESLIDRIEPIPSDDGLQHYSSTSKYILRDTTGNIIGLYGTGRDVTEYRTAFEQLKLLTDSMPGGLATYALSPEGLRLVYFNDGLCKLFGCTREEYAVATRESVITTVFPEDVPRLNAQISRMIEDGTPVNCTYRIRSIKDDSYKWLNLRATPAEMHGGSLQAHAVFYDITEQKLAEEAALIHAEEMRLAMSQLGKMICEYDPAARTLTVPETFAAAYNLPPAVTDMPESLLRAGIIDSATQDAYRGFYDAILRGDATGAAEYRDKSADGSVHWRHVEFSSIFDSAGKPVKAIVAVEDTTARHTQYELEQARPTLGEGNLLVHALFNLSTGETLDYAYSDERTVPPEERTAFLFGGDNLDDIIIDSAERSAYRALNDPKALLARFENGETELSIDYRRKMPSGEIIWVRNLLRMIREPSGSDVLLFEYCYTIEEEKTRELMYAALAHENYDYVCRVNARNGHFTVMACKAGYGMPPARGEDLDAAMQQLAEEYVHPDDREPLLAAISVAGAKRNLAYADRYPFAFRLVQPDGEIRHKKLTVFYLDRERDIFIITREDVSSVVQAEMRKNEQLSDALAAANQASRAKGQFLSRMSHELRTPMNAIIGLAALSATEINDPKAMEDSIAKIGMSARYLLSLINDILEMSRIESGRMSLNEAPFEFERLISEVNNVIYAQATEKGLDYDAIVNGCTEASYMGDATKLQQILLNVLGNAVKFTPRGGKVTLSIEQLQRTKKGVALRFTITDTGIGIDEAFLPHLFDLFSQEAAGATATATGTGLGLAITKNLVELMNGKISVKSIKDVGSEFTITVQLGVTRESEQYLDMAASMKLDTLRALIVDDDVMVCKSTEDILKALGMQAEWADSGLRAVERVQQAHTDGRDFNTIIIDWKMPDMDGIETTRRIRAIVGPSVTIIIMTAYDWRSIETEAREAGVDLFMEKPLFQSSIVKAFEQVFMTHRIKAEPQPPSRPDFTGKRILLAEDHPLNVEVAKRLLERVGAEIIVANNGLEALELFTTEPDGFFDAILMDIRMPVMDGLTATKSIRKLKKASGKTVPIIAMTANAFDEDVELSLASGMNAHLAKPIEPQTLFATLKRLMKNGATPSPAEK